MKQQQQKNSFTLVEVNHWLPQPIQPCQAIFYMKTLLSVKKWLTTLLSRVGQRLRQIHQINTIGQLCIYIQLKVGLIKIQHS